jgi:hypothetical protein
VTSESTIPSPWRRLLNLAGDPDGIAHDIKWGFVAA